jgi:LytS/YehU family sensor histidine kinase
MQTSPIPLRIIITTKIIDTYLNISVFNTGKWIERREKDSTRRGLENIKQRLKIYSPNDHKFQVIKNTDSVQVNMSLSRVLNSN